MISINGGFDIATFDYRRVGIKTIIVRKTYFKKRAIIIQKQDIVET